jgi:hypothetical protein
MKFYTRLIWQIVTSKQPEKSADQGARLETIA